MKYEPTLQEILDMIEEFAKRELERIKQQGGHSVNSQS